MDIQKYLIAGAAGIMIVAIVIGLGLGWLKMHDAVVRSNALNEFNKKQQEVIIQQQADNQKRLIAIFDLNEQLMKDLREQTAKVDKSIEQVEQMLNDPKTIDRDSSEVLKQTIRMLRGGK